MATMTRRPAFAALPALLAAGVSYDHYKKMDFKRQGTAALRALATTLGLPKDSYTIRYNEGGIAVSGEATLHHERFYVQISEPFGHGDPVLYRTVKGRKDYTGGPNRYASAAQLVDTDAFAARIRREMFGVTE